MIAPRTVAPRGQLPLENCKYIFVLFWNYFHFKWKAKLVIVFQFCLTKQWRYATYDLETCCSYLGTIKHILFWLSYLHIPVSAVFSFFLFA